LEQQLLFESVDFRRNATMRRCPRCGEQYDHEIAILREEGVEIAYAHIDAEGGVDMCHSDVLDLPRPYVYDEESHTVYGTSEVRD
jgi:hypothetical protein